MLQSAPEGVELSKVLTLSISSKGSSGPRIHPTFPNASSKNWKTGFLPHESKNRISFDFFPNYELVEHFMTELTVPYSYASHIHCILWRSNNEIWVRDLFISLSLSEFDHFWPFLTIFDHFLAYTSLWRTTWRHLQHPSLTLTTVIVFYGDLRANNGWVTSLSPSP